MTYQYVNLMCVRNKRLFKKIGLIFASFQRKKIEKLLEIIIIIEKDTMVLSLKNNQFHLFNNSKVILK